MLNIYKKKNKSKLLELCYDLQHYITDFINIKDKLMFNTTNKLTYQETIFKSLKIKNGLNLIKQQCFLYRTVAQNLVHNTINKFPSCMYDCLYMLELFQQKKLILNQK